MFNIYCLSTKSAIKLYYTFKLSLKELEKIKFIASYIKFLYPKPVSLRYKLSYAKLVNLLYK